MILFQWFAKKLNEDFETSVSQQDVNLFATEWEGKSRFHIDKLMLGKIPKITRYTDSTFMVIKMRQELVFLLVSLRNYMYWKITEHCNPLR